MRRKREAKAQAGKCQSESIQEAEVRRKSLRPMQLSDNLSQSRKQRRGAGKTTRLRKGT